ncbi:MAG TPA: type II CAAX endopeptidase family protein [Ignavibacteria bacterium]
MLKYYLSVALACVLWFLMFVVKPIDNFWIMMTFSASLLSVISLSVFRDQLSLKNFNFKEISIGIISAVILYIVFYTGRQMLDLFHIIPDHQQGISNVYARPGAIPKWLIGMLLFFPIGFGEEIFWRGFLQRLMAKHHGQLKAFSLTTFFYTAVHFPTLNPVLILAAFLVGIFWGLMFIWRGNNIVPVLISHMVWDPLIFIILPVN